MATILVVEDNPANMKLAVFLLQNAGYVVLNATDAESGLALAREAHPDLILMDIQLPGMDGLAATALLKQDEATRAIPVIALTALAMKGDEARIRAAGCAGYIAKPMAYREALATIADQLRERMTGSADTPAAPARILIVDDGEDNRELLRVILNWEGYVIQTAASGEQALASVAEAPPDLLLLDLILPGLSGCEVTAQLKANVDTELIPIIVISGRSDEATRRLALGAGAVDFISKPIDRADLCRRVRSTLGLSAKSAAP